MVLTETQVHDMLIDYASEKMKTVNIEHVKSLH